MQDPASVTPEEPPVDHSVPTSGSVRRGGARRMVLVAGGLAVAVLVGTIVTRPDRSSVPPTASTASTAPSAPTDQPVGGGNGSRSAGTAARPGVPAALLAAERYVAGPSAATLRALADAVGGLDAIVIGEAVGAFDLVRFDPLDHDRALASQRSSYGRAQNQDANERWTIGESGLTQTLWAPDMAHDFVHFNADGSITAWINEAGGASFAPRTAVVRHGGTQTTTAAIYASRFAAKAGAVFALTDDGDYYSDDDGYVELIVEGAASEVLSPAAAYGWIDIPTPGLLVAYPLEETGATAVWDTETLLPVSDSPLAGRRHQRSAVSGDGRTAVGVTFDGRLEQIDMATGQVVADFGSVDPRDIDRPVTLNADGTTVTTVDRSGTVTLWWVGDDRPIARLAASSAQPRWVSERYGARSASAVASSGERVAVRAAARQRVPVTWTIIDTNPDQWLARACELAGRALSVEERATYGLDGSPAACI